jgi:hypothetical protein
VIESVRAAEGDAAIGPLYTAIGAQVHHQGNSFVAATDVLVTAGLSPSHADAFGDDAWDSVIEASMAEGLALTGNDVGTPIIGFTREDGSKVGFFGPVISRRLPIAQALDLWDGLILCTGVDGFWELKRTRTENPNFDLPGD